MWVPPPPRARLRPRLVAPSNGASSGLAPAPDGGAGGAPGRRGRPRGDHGGGGVPRGRRRSPRRAPEGRADDRGRRPGLLSHLHGAALGSRQQLHQLCTSAAHRRDDCVLHGYTGSLNVSYLVATE